LVWIETTIDFEFFEVAWVGFMMLAEGDALNYRDTFKLDNNPLFLLDL
jgi:hypothetical protein